MGTLAATGAWLAAASAVTAQVRVGQWNITNYSGPSARDPDFRTALYALAPNGLRFAPDVLVIQEVIQGGSGNTPTRQAAGQANVNAFLSVLNTAAGSPGDWAAVPYVANGGDTGNALYYRTSRFAWMGTATLATDTGTGPDQAPRDTQRWRMRLAGYSGNGSQIYLYGAHFKAGSTSADQLRRDPEGERIRIDANALPDDTNFVICADFNVQSSAQTFYQYMVGNSGAPAFTADPSGRAFDPINTPGGTTSTTDWENNPTYAFIHTQDPALAMDSRHDQILISSNLRDAQGMLYMPAGAGGNILAPWNLSTFADPNHSYRAWGNDGTSYNAALTVTGNAMVGPTIAQALINSANGGGHLPVYLDLQVPAKVAAPSSIDFGTVAVNAIAQLTVQIGNGANVALWSKDGTGRGIDTLNYSLATTLGFSTAAGPFADAPGGSLNGHIVSMNTATPGMKAGTLIVSSDDPDSPALVIPFTGMVQAMPDYDVNNDGVADIEDLYRWFVAPTDVDGSGVTDAADAVALRNFLRAGEVDDTIDGRR